MPCHPGHTLRDAFLAPLGIKPTELAQGLGVERSTISRLLNGKQSLTPAMAARLGAYFQVPALWFLEMQAAYDAALAEATPTQEVTPRPRDRHTLLTPSGVRLLGPRSSRPTAMLIPYTDFKQNPPPTFSAASEVRQIEYENGSIALVYENS